MNIWKQNIKVSLDLELKTKSHIDKEQIKDEMQKILPYMIKDRMNIGVRINGNEYFITVLPKIKNVLTS